MLQRPAIWISGLTLFAAAIWFAACQQGQQPLVGGEGAYLNLDREVQYTGRESCAPCHQEIYDSYLRTGMGKSFYLPERSKIVEDFGPASVVYDAPSGYYYQPSWRGNTFLIREFRLDGCSSPPCDTTYLREEVIDFIVGSGHQTRSYVLKRGEYLYEAPITWYVGKKRWDLSPGYHDGNNTRFDREIGEECMACHTGTIDFVEGSENRFHEISLGIDCEKCHGPGQIHIERMEKDQIVDVGEEIDYSIVNPAKMSVDLQFDVCQQCHLQGVNVLKNGHGSVTDYRPGMRLSEVYDIFIEQYSRVEDFGIASHGERLRQSACFLQSDGKLSCTTCHDPHVSIAEMGTDVYTKQCQSCHQGAELPDCGADAELRMLSQDNCVSCHMPSGGTSDIPHVTFTDHFIRVVRPKDSISAEDVRRFVGLVNMTSHPADPGTAAEAYLQYYERVSGDPDHLALALQALPASAHASRAKALRYQGQLEAALSEAEQALADQPGDVWLRFLRGELLEGLGRRQEALDVFRAIYAERPDITESGQKAGLLELALVDPSQPQRALASARAYFEACLERKPFDKSYLVNLSFVEMNSGAFDQARLRLRQALQLDPFYGQALENLFQLEVALGDKAAAEAVLNRLAGAQPPVEPAKLEALRNRLP